MRRFTNEFLVGLLTIGATGLTAWGIMRSDDRPGDTTGSYEMYAVFPSVEGIYPDTPVKLAGVPVGAVEEVTLDPEGARIRISLLATVQLPVDSVAELKSEGVLGDRFVRLVPGKSDQMMTAGGVVSPLTGGADLDSMTIKVSAIADDIKVITGTVRGLTESGEIEGKVENILTNIDLLTAELRSTVGDNRAEVDRISSNLLEVSESLRQLVAATGGGVETELAAVRTATETLDRTLRNVEDMTGRINRGEGTLGQLINDDSTINSINATLADVQGMVGSVSKLQTQVYYRGGYFFGSDPSAPGFTQNPVAGSARNTLGVRLLPREDYGYLVELVSHPTGTITYEDHIIPDFGTSYREYVVAPEYRFSFQFMKRFHNTVARFGVKESSGGVGVDQLFWDDRIELSADLYDFTYGSWPVLDGTPNLELVARLRPVDHLYLEAGVNNVILGARYGYLTGFAGGGFTFDDQDLKFVLAALPISP